MLEVVCGKGTVRWDFPRNVVEWQDETTGEMHQQHFYQNVDKDTARNDMYVKELEYFFGIVGGTKKPVSDIAHALLVTETLISLKKSGKQK